MKVLGCCPTPLSILCSFTLAIWTRTLSLREISSAKTGPGLPWEQVFRAGALEPGIWGPQREVVTGERCEKSD